MLALSGFEKYFGGKPVLDLGDWVLEPGLHWVKGPNGCGKSTFFRCLAGLLPFEGQVLLSGKWEIRRDPVAYRLRVNHAEAEPRFPAYLSGREVVEFVSRAKKSPQGQLQRLAGDLELPLFWHAPMGTYSSGMLKKLSLVMAFCGNPEWIILDEPLITLDARSLEVLSSWIATAREQSGVNLLFSSHQPVEWPVGPVFSWNLPEVNRVAAPAS